MLSSSLTTPRRRLTDNGAMQPVRIHAQRLAGTLEIEWEDGHQTRYDAETLRRLCPCAYCRGEGGLPGWLDQHPTFTPDQIRLVDVQLAGNYAIRPVWGDGHEIGFYSFELLRSQCPCPSCSAARGAPSGRREGGPPPVTTG
jgi:DUF971 family protein